MLNITFIRYELFKKSIIFNLMCLLSTITVINYYNYYNLLLYTITTVFTVYNQMFLRVLEKVQMYAQQFSREICCREYNLSCNFPFVSEQFKGTE